MTTSPRRRLRRKEANAIHRRKLPTTAPLNFSFHLGCCWDDNRQATDHNRSLRAPRCRVQPTESSPALLHATRRGKLTSLPHHLRGFCGLFPVKFDPDSGTTKLTHESQRRRLIARDTRARQAGTTTNANGTTLRADISACKRLARNLRLCRSTCRGKTSDSKLCAKLKLRLMPWLALQADRMQATHTSKVDGDAASPGRRPLGFLRCAIPEQGPSTMLGRHADRHGAKTSQTMWRRSKETGHGPRARTTFADCYPLARAAAATEAGRTSKRANETTAFRPMTSGCLWRAAHMTVPGAIGALLSAMQDSNAGHPRWMYFFSILAAIRVRGPPRPKNGDGAEMRMPGRSGRVAPVQHHGARSLSRAERRTRAPQRLTPPRAHAGGDTCRYGHLPCCIAGRSRLRAHNTRKSTRWRLAAPRAAQSPVAAQSPTWSAQPRASSAPQRLPSATHLPRRRRRRRRVAMRPEGKPQGVHRRVHRIDRRP